MVDIPLYGNKSGSAGDTLNKKVYFISDVHLGILDYESSLKREKILVNWLDGIKNQALEIYLLGDIFDFWFEYKDVIPKGYTRLLGKLAELTDLGIKVFYFTGNHDMWHQEYFTKELNIQLHRKPTEKYIGNKYFMIGHGDGLGPDDKSYKIIKKIFQNRISQKIFSFFHPRIGIGLANFFSRKSRINNAQEVFLGEDKERLVLYCKYKLTQKHYDFFVFGHRHLPMSVSVGKNSLYVNTGEWINTFSYAVFDGEDVKLEYFDPKKEAVHA